MQYLRIYGFPVFEYRCMAEKASFRDGVEFTEAASVESSSPSITPILARAVVMKVTSLTPYVSLPVCHTHTHTHTPTHTHIPLVSVGR